jgi:DNA-binding NtrC family response regulator
MDTYEPGGTETVLVVEDEEYLLNTVCLLLKSKGYNVFSAQDGKEAINIYKKHGQEIDLVLTDLGLPSMTGMEEFNQLQEINPSVLVVFASGYFEPDMKAKLQKSGAAGFLQKPFLSDDVLMKIRKAFDGRKEKGFHENL